MPTIDVVVESDIKRPGKSQGKSGTARCSTLGKRFNCAVFEYCGAPMEDKRAAMSLLTGKT